MVNKSNEKIFIQHLKQGVLLLAMKEFNDFHFEINKDSSTFQGLGHALVKEGIKIENYNRGLRQMAVNILEKDFNKEKQKVLYEIFSKLETKYEKSSPEIYKTVLACKLFLEDENTKKNHMPIAIARLMEDTLKAFSN